MSSHEAIAQSGDAILCHCMIAHPDKPKFLVLRHADRWSPPVLQVPSAGALMYKPAVINEGMMQKYGLRTTVQRIVVQAQNYAQVELELHASSRQQMQAVWVGREEYTRFRRSEGGDNDVFEQWLDERERTPESDLRAPWQKPGWYRGAREWFLDRLIDLGIQTTGSVQQFKAGWPTACLLRVATVQGQVYFKAGDDKPPGEARLTEFLSKHWPDLVPEPLAVDHERQWMIMRDFKLRGENQPTPESYPDFARALGVFQVEAMHHMDDWHRLQCPVMDLPFLLDEDGRAGALIRDVETLLCSGLRPLGAAGIGRFRKAVGSARDSCRRLAEYGIPDSLVHMDYRPDNFFLEQGRCRAMDWADVAVSHPFIAMCQTVDFLARNCNREPFLDQYGPVDEARLMAVRDAYLSAFEGLQPAKDLLAAFETAQEVFPYFWLLYETSQLQTTEAGAPREDALNQRIRSGSRRLIEHLGSGD